MSIKIKIKSDESIIEVNGKITIETVPEFEEQFFNLINNGHKKITIDMKETAYIDSSGLGAFIRIKNVTGKAEADLKLINVNKNVFDVFKFANLDGFFNIELL
jgi:anti-sigma B factor antagonist